MSYQSGVIPVILYKCLICYKNYGELELAYNCREGHRQRELLLRMEREHE